MDTFLDDIKRRVTAGERVKLIGFGVLFLHEVAPRKRRNIPVTEDEEWRIPSFKLSAQLKNRVQRAAIEEARDVD